MPEFLSPATLGKDRTSKATCVANHADLSSHSRLHSLAPAALEVSLAPLKLGLHRSHLSAGSHHLHGSAGLSTGRPPGTCRMSSTPSRAHTLPPLRTAPRFVTYLTHYPKPHTVPIASSLPPGGFVPNTPVCPYDCQAAGARALLSAPSVQQALPIPPRERSVCSEHLLQLPRPPVADPRHLPYPLPPPTPA